MRRPPVRPSRRAWLAGIAPRPHPSVAVPAPRVGVAPRDVPTAPAEEAGGQRREHEHGHLNDQDLDHVITWRSYRPGHTRSNEPRLQSLIFYPVLPRRPRRALRDRRRSQSVYDLSSPISSLGEPGRVAPCPFLS
jgi:hypothetical protein